MRIRWQTRGHSSSYGAVELRIAAAHRWVSSVSRHAFSLSLFKSMLLKTSLLIANYYYFFLEELCLELARAIEAGDTQAASQHASALARQKAVLTIQLSEKNYAEGEIR